MKPQATLSAREARWLAIEAQGLRDPRPTAPANRRNLRRVIDRIGVLQLDAINVLDRTQYLVLFSRLGAYDREHLHRMTGPGGELFEYDGHAASLQPTAIQPLLRWRMAQAGNRGGKWGEYERRYEEAYRDYIAAVLSEVRERGPLAGSALSDPRPNVGTWWGRRSDGRQALEWLLRKGQLAAWRTPAFERVYDVPERVLPREILDAPTPPVADAHRELVAKAARSLGVATIGDLADYYRIKRGEAKAAAKELVDAGTLVAVDVEGWKQPAYCPAAAHPRPPARDHATLLSPFDSLIWERERTNRLFGFDYRIEVYVPAPKREFGYYVLPLLLGDELVGRFDLKADRAASVLRVQAAHVEEGAEPAVVAAAARAELGRLTSWLGLDGIAVNERGNLAGLEPT